MELTIKTNRHWRPFACRYEVPKVALADQFDYQDEEESIGGFFQYRGIWYHLDGFTRMEPMSDSDPHAIRPAGDSPFKGWHGQASDSFYSGVLIRLSEDGEEYQIATYHC